MPDGNPLAYMTPQQQVAMALMGPGSPLFGAMAQANPQMIPPQGSAAFQEFAQFNPQVLDALRANSQPGQPPQAPAQPNAMQFAAPSTRSQPEFLRTSDQALIDIFKTDPDPARRQRAKQDAGIRVRDNVWGMPGALPVPPQVG